MSLDGQPIQMIKDHHGMHVADADELQRIRTRLAMVFQHFNLWSHMTVLENITMAPRRVLGSASRKPTTAPVAISTRSACRHGSPSNTRRFSPAASNNAWPLPAPWRWSRR